MINPKLPPKNPLCCSTIGRTPPLELSCFIILSSLRRRSWESGPICFFLWVYEVGSGLTTRFDFRPLVAPDSRMLGASTPSPVLGASSLEASSLASTLCQGCCGRRGWVEPPDLDFAMSDPSTPSLTQPTHPYAQLSTAVNPTVSYLNRKGNHRRKNPSPCREDSSGASGPSSPSAPSGVTSSSSSTSK